MLNCYLLESCTGPYVIKGWVSEIFILFGKSGIESSQSF